VVLEVTTPASAAVPAVTAEARERALRWMAE
jgi:hypothetical protein